MSQLSTTKRILFTVTTPLQDKTALLTAPVGQSALKHCDLSPSCDTRAPKEAHLLHSTVYDYCPMLLCKYCAKQYKRLGAYKRHMAEHDKFKLIRANKALRIVNQEIVFQYEGTNKLLPKKSYNINDHSSGNGLMSEYGIVANTGQTKVLRRKRQRKRGTRIIPKAFLIREFNRCDSSTDESNFDN